MSTSFTFVGFSLVVVLLYHAWRSAGWRQAVLFIASCVFLASFVRSVEPLIPLIAFLLLGYVGLKLIQREPRYAFLPVLLVTLATFIWLKKYAFVPGSLLLPIAYVTVGLSYILFRVLHLMIDARSKAAPEKINLLAYFNYTANFATLSSGPIQLYPAYAKTRDAASTATLSKTNVAEGLERIIKGLFKTNVLSLVFSSLQTQALSAVTGAETSAEKLLAATLLLLMYPFFLYCNFSGYIDIVIGVGRLLGYTLPENFNRPFSSDNFLDFWTNRWHITLSGWLKAYVYNPLLVTLMRRVPSRTMEPFLGVFAFFVTFFLVGAWHGQTSEFLMYGILLGLGVSVNKAYQILMTRRLGRKSYAALSANGFYIALSRGLTFTYFCLTLILFWSNWQQIRVLQSTLGAGSALAVCAAIFVLATGLLAAWEGARNRMEAGWGDQYAPLFPFVRTAVSTTLLVIILTISLLMNQRAPEIVYKAF